jgi:hypothetical protein
MNKPIVTLDTMRSDHRNWLAAHAQWRLDIERWQAEHTSAVTRLAEMQKVVADHGESLAEHARAFRKIEEAIADHEREIANQQRGAGGQPYDVMANRHQEEEGVFSRQKDAHERIRKHHEAVMAQLEALECAAGSAM